MPTTSENLLVVREAGGFGDICSVTAACRQYRVEHPSASVLLAIPRDFIELAERLTGPTGLIALPSVKDIAPLRRRRDEPLTDAVAMKTYLRELRPFLGRSDLTVVSAYCPAYSYEASCDRALRFNRPQLFAIAMGCREVGHVCPSVRPDWMAQNTDNTIIFAPRGTCPCRSMSLALQSNLLAELTELTDADIYYVDAVQPSFLLALPRNVKLFINHPLNSLIEKVASCRLVLSVDSFILHLAAATNRSAVGVFGPTDGANTVRTYPFATAVDGQGGRCKLPCNYAEPTGWDRQCRQDGCERMAWHDGHVDQIITEVRRRLS
jgi:hypothetical protein